MYVHTYVYGHTDVPNVAPTNVRIPEDDITSESFVVQWDALDVTYTVTWYNESGIIGMDTVNGLSYTVTGLTANTYYKVTITTSCQAGSGSNGIVITNHLPPTLRPHTSSISHPKPTSSATSASPGNVIFYCYYACVYFAYYVYHSGLCEFLPKCATLSQQYNENSITYNSL